MTYQQVVPSTETGRQVKKWLDSLLTISLNYDTLIEKLIIGERNEHNST